MPSLPKADAANADGVLQYALEALTCGATASWSDPEHDASGAVTPLRTFRTRGGLYCREVEESISLEGAADSYRLVGGPLSPTASGARRRPRTEPGGDAGGTGS